MEIIRQIKTFRNKRMLFTTPGHNMGKLVPKSIKNLLGKKIFLADFSAVEDFDNIRNPQGIFLYSQNKAAQIYNTKNSFYLYNGSSSGILAAMLTFVKEGDKVLIARNAHLSVYNALVLTGAIPIWLNPNRDKDWQIPLAVEANQIEKALEENQDIKAVFITSPTYQGVVSDVESISKSCKKYDALLFVDQAHGALWNFSDKLPKSAVLQGADMAVESLHKTATSLNQGAILHISKESKIEPYKVQKALNIINTTSPSYPILASIEASINFLNSKTGQRKLDEYLENVLLFRKEADSLKNIQIYKNQDFTKLLIKHKAMGGFELSDFLMNNKIEDEMTNSFCVLCLTGVGTTKKMLDRLLKVLKKVNKIAGEIEPERFDFISPKMILTPRQAYFKEGKELAPNEAIGEISKELIAPYPPGIPVLMPGELVKEEHLRFIKQEKIHVVKD